MPPIPADNDADAEETLSFGEFRLLPRRRQLLHRDHVLRLGGRSFELLLQLLQRPGEVIGKDELIARVWPGSVVEEGNLRMHVAALRKLLATAGDGLECIRNVPLRGYCFVAPVRRGLLAPEAAASAVPAAPGARLPASNLTVALSRPVGRDEALARIAAQIGTLRCITLLGPAGIGKSLLALTAARQLLDAFDGAVWQLDFAPLCDARLVPSALATLVGVPTLAGDPMSDILAVLGRQRALLVFDNCEHVIDAVAGLAERLLAGAPQVRLICTSREPLRIADERAQRVAALGQPPPDLALDAASALSWPAVQLLVERASASIDGFVFRDSDVPAAVQLCQRLDGLPLAIELVSTRATSFGLRELAERLDDHMALLTPGRRTALPRQRTLQAALDWSHGLLGDTERQVLRQLAVFRGRFTLDDAQAVCSGGALVVAEAVGGLAVKSLVEVSAGEALPYRLLRMTRSHAAAQLGQDADEPALRRRHAQRLRAVLEHAEAQLESLSAEAWRALYAPRLDDVRAALDACMADPQAELLAAELVAAAGPLWFHLGLVRECIDRVDQVEHLAERLPPDPVREMRLALARGHACLHLEGAGARSDAALSRSLVLATELARVPDQLRALWGLFIERMMRGDHHGARDIAARFRAASEGQDDLQLALTSERMLALVLHLSGEHAAAREHAERALQSGPATMRFLHGSAYHVDHESSTLAPLARVMWLLGHEDDAAELAQLAVTRAQRLDHGFSLTYALALAALPIALWQGDLDTAQAYHEQLRDCTVRHSLEFWQSWSAAYANVIAWRRSGSTATPDWLDVAARLPGRADMLGTFGEALVTPLAMQRAEAGRNAWCAAELRRAAAMHAWRDGRHDRVAAQGEIEAALALARSQGAIGWERRCLASLAQLD